jgi:hypothetical protein
MMSDLSLDEKMTQLEIAEISKRAVILANIIELTSSVIKNIAGEEIADVLNNQGLTKQILANMIGNVIKERTLI